MRTDDLIVDLSTDLKPVRRGGVERLLAVGLMTGAAIAFVLMALWLGMRPDMPIAIRASSFWMKACYTLLVASLGFVLASSAGRPGAQLLPFSLLLVLAFAVIAGVGAAQAMHAPPTLRPALFFGGSYRVCPWLILVISAPILVGVLVVMRRMAPTRPMLAGAAAGVLAGGAGATVYGLHCTESSALFVAVWYSLGILGVGSIGALAGRFALRW
jgi:hypothetical protein